MNVIGHEILVFDSLFDDRMSSIHNVDGQGIIDLGRRVIVQLSGLGQSRKGIDLPYEACGFFDSLILPGHLSLDPFKDLIFQSRPLLLRPQDLFLVFF